MARPDAVLFNGGFFTPRSRAIRCSTRSPPGSARGRGCSRTRRRRRRWRSARRSTAGCARIPRASKRLLIRAGSARSYYIGVDGRGRPRPAAVCVMPRGTEEGTRFELDRELIGRQQPAGRFTLYSSIDRDGPGRRARHARRGGRCSQRHAPLVTALPLRQALAAGAARGPAERRLHRDRHARALVPRRRDRSSLAAAFNLRAVEADPLDDRSPKTESSHSESAIVVDRGRRWRPPTAVIRAVFGSGAGRSPPEALTGRARNARRARQARVAAAGHPGARRRAARGRRRAPHERRRTKCAG